MISLVNRMNEGSIEDESLYQDIKRVFSIIKKGDEFKEIKKDEMKNILMGSLEVASSQFIDNFPETEIKKEIYTLMGEEEPNEKFINIMIENLKTIAKQNHYNRAKEIIDRVIDNEWN